MREGIDKQTLDGISEEWFNETSEKLKRNTYKPNPARRVNIPKANGKTRPLGISSPIDKIVQQSMRLVLEAVLEPRFQDTSHGFRPKRGCHTALKTLRGWTGVAWFIEGDISKIFDCIDHNLLAQNLGEHFREKNLDNLYWKLVKAGYVEFNSKTEKFHPSIVGVPQGGIISPLLSNLMLDKLDKYIEDLRREQLARGEGQKHFLINPEDHKISSKVQNAREKIKRWKKKDICTDPLKQDKKKLLIARNNLKSTIPNPNYIRIEYTRYADDWLVGVWGDRDAAIDIKNKIKEFLEGIKLELCEEKTLITQARGGVAKFLGTEIKKNAHPKSILVKKNNRQYRQRTTSGDLLLEIPIEKIVQKLADKKVLKREKDTLIMRSLANLTLLPDRDIIIRYKATWNGILNYYSFADNIYLLHKIFWILRESLRMTLSRKHKLNKTEFNKKYKGRNSGITVVTYKENQRVETVFELPPLKKNPMNFLTSTDKDPWSFLNMEIRTINDFGRPCANCGTTEKV